MGIVENVDRLQLAARVPDEPLTEDFLLRVILSHNLGALVAADKVVLLVDQEQAKVSVFLD